MPVPGPAPSAASSRPTRANHDATCRSTPAWSSFKRKAAASSAASTSNGDKPFAAAPASRPAPSSSSVTPAGSAPPCRCPAAPLRRLRRAAGCCCCCCGDASSRRRWSRCCVASATSSSPSPSTSRAPSSRSPSLAGSSSSSPSHAPSSTHAASASTSSPALGRTVSGATAAPPPPPPPAAASAGRRLRPAPPPLPSPPPPAAGAAHTSCSEYEGGSSSHRCGSTRTAAAGAAPRAPAARAVDGEGGQKLARSCSTRSSLETSGPRHAWRLCCLRMRDGGFNRCGSSCVPLRPTALRRARRGEGGRLTWPVARARPCRRRPAPCWAAAPPPSCRPGLRHITRGGTAGHSETGSQGPAVCVCVCALRQRNGPPPASCTKDQQRGRLGTSPGQSMRHLAARHGWRNSIAAAHARPEQQCGSGKASPSHELAALCCATHRARATASARPAACGGAATGPGAAPAAPPPPPSARERPRRARGGLGAAPGGSRGRCSAPKRRPSCGGGCAHAHTQSAPFAQVQVPCGEHSIEQTRLS